MLCIDVSLSGEASNFAYLERISMALERDNEELFKQLRSRPKLALPTVVLCFINIFFVVTAWTLYLQGIIPIWVGTIINCLAFYYSFSVIHDGLHRSISINEKVNDSITVLATMLVTLNPTAYHYARYFHMQHHIKCGEEGLDPDLEISSKGSHALYKWFFWGLHYLALRPYPKLNVPNVGMINIIWLVSVVTLFVFFPLEMLMLAVIPLFFLLWMTAFVFSYLPHHIHQRVPGEDELDKYQSTCNRIGWEWLLSPLCQYQNYHLVHHLYPTVPFYRYVKIWNARKSEHEKNNPALVNAFSNQPTYY